MRALVLLPSLLDSIGGIQTYSQALVWALNDVAREAGGSVRVLALHDREGERNVPGLDTVTLRGFGGKRLAFGFAAVAEASHADTVILAHVNFTPLLHGMRLVSPKARTYVSAHGIDVWKPLGSIRLSALRRVTAVWPVSAYTHQRMMAENPALRHIRFDILPNTLGPQVLVATPRSQTKQPSPAGQVLLCVSRMAASEPYKNIELLIRSMPAVLARQPDTKLILVGPGDDRHRLEAVSASLGVDGRVRFVGRISDEELQAHFAACDLFVLPSTGEGFGIVYLEAMQHGKACIGARAAAVPEVIKDEVTGLLVDPAKPEELPTAIVRLLEDETLRTRLGSQGRQRLEEKFSMTAFRRRLETLLRG